MVIMKQLLLFLLTIFVSTAIGSSNTLPGCNNTCGAISIPYPFGFSPGCHLPGFNLSCNFTNGTYKPFLHENELVDIDLSSGRARVNNNISSICHSPTGKITSYAGGVSLVDTPYRFSNTQNKITIIGCETFAFVGVSQDSTRSFTGGCVSECADLVGIVNGTCSGIGCCQTAIPKGMNVYEVEFDSRYNNSMVYQFNPCSYVVLREDAGFVFDTSYITTKALLGKQAPLVLDWAIRNETCVVARAERSYACVSENSECVDSTNDPGYWCKCSSGYQGNPYLLGGCQDINECVAMNPCGKSSECRNTPGGYDCLCPIGKRASRENGACELQVSVIVGICVSPLVLLLLGLGIYVLRERRKLKKVKEMYFKQHGGWILFEEMKSSKSYGFTIFSEEDIAKATNNYDSAQIIGHGGHGTVYKGILKGNVVAIKKCKIIDESQKKEFGKEMLILSEINHKNIVKLLGCCLEVEVPILVYEFISNGTLFQKIHDKKHHGLHLSLEDRLRIAHESAEALAYLHSSASPPILHGDVKSSNILLDDNYTAKVSDFGASILAPNDESQFVTLVQGTCGYLDPECLLTCQLTNKSDVFSFGVVLLELLTGKRPIYFDKPGDEKVLSSSFLSAMKENRVKEFLDYKITEAGEMDLIMQVAELAEECLHLKGEDRPSMKEVADFLGRLMPKISRKSCAVEILAEEVQSLLCDKPSYYIDNTRCFSIEREVAEEMQTGR